jgi:hypothetical protein
MFDDLIPKKAPMTATQYASDVARSAGAGLERGTIGLVGLPGDIKALSDIIGAAPGQWLESHGYIPPRNANVKSALPAPPTSQEVIRAAEEAGVPGVGYQPQTTAGKFARTAGEFVPSALIGPGNIAGNAMKFGVLPGLASEAAGQITHGTPIEPYARGAAALVTGSLGALSGRPSVAERAISRAAEGMTPAQLDATESLFQEALQNGVNITRAQAAQFVTNGATRLADLQRVVEGQGGLRDFFASVPEGVDAYGRRVIGDIAETPTHPSMIGPKTQEAAQSIIGDTQAEINAQTRPLYEQVATRRGGPPVGNYLAKDPIYKETLAEIRSTPSLNRTIADLPDDNAAVIDLVQRRMAERAEAARMPGQASTSNLAALNLQDARQAAVKAAENITGSRPEKGVVGSYEAARAEQAQLREEKLSPLMAGPIGKLSNKPEVSQAIEALFPRNPIPNSAGEVKNAVTALSAKNPWAARQLVRAHVESVFNNATRDLQAGMNQFGGASFKAQLTGNSQQAENLAAALRGLPEGDAILPGFNRMLEIMEATGQRQRIGSQTAFNTEMQEALKTGRTLTEVGALAAGAGVKLPARIRDAYQRWNLGKNIDEIARLLTEPEAAAVFRSLAEAAPGSARAAQAAARLVYISQNAAKSSDKRKERASGGRVDKRDYPAKKASKLDKHAKMAKDAIGRELLPLMQVPDHVVAHALRLARQ